MDFRGSAQEVIQGFYRCFRVFLTVASIGLNLWRLLKLLQLELLI